MYAKEFLDKMGKKDQYAVVELDDPENRYMGAALSASLNVSTVGFVLGVSASLCLLRQRQGLLLQCYFVVQYCSS